VPLTERVLFSSSDDSDKARQQQQSLKIMVVVPGRELASQVVSVARQLLEGTGMSAMLAIGGTGFSRNLQDIREKKPSIIVGTPGRIAELIVGKPEEKYVPWIHCCRVMSCLYCLFFLCICVIDMYPSSHSCRSARLKVPNLQSLVLDEFDALLEYKPRRDPTAALVSALKQRHGDALQSILCSATATDMVGSSKLNSYLRPGFAQAMADRDDVLVTSPGSDAAGKGTKKGVTRVSRTVIHSVVHVEHRRFALDTLRRILHRDPMPQQILVFAENSRKVTIIVEKVPVRLLSCFRVFWLFC
jgi:superfamily II DNA/RNA helicase